LSGQEKKTSKPTPDKRASLSVLLPPKPKAPAPRPQEKQNSPQPPPPSQPVITQVALNLKMKDIQVYNLNEEPIFVTEVWKDQITVVTWLRHFGCVFCKQMASNLTEIKPLLDKAGVKLVAIGNGSAKQAKRFLIEVGYEGELFVDPERKSYQAAGMKSGVMSLLSVSAVSKVTNAWKEGHRQASTQGSNLQQGGLIVVNGDKILFRHIDASVGDAPDINEVLKACGIEERRSLMSEDDELVF